MQVKKYKEDMRVPEIRKSPGCFEGAEFSFKEILFEIVELEVSNSYIYTHTTYLHP